MSRFLVYMRIHASSMHTATIVIIITYKGSDALRAPKFLSRPDGRYARPGKAVWRPETAARNTHTETNNNTIATTTHGLHPTSTKKQIYRSTDHHVPQHKTIVHGQLTDRPCTRGSAPGPRWGRCPQTPVFSRFALAISRCAFNAVLLSSSN